MRIYEEKTAEFFMESTKKIGREVGRTLKKRKKKKGEPWLRIN